MSCKAALSLYADAGLARPALFDIAAGRIIARCGHALVSLAGPKAIAGDAEPARPEQKNPGSDAS